MNEKWITDWIPSKRFPMYTRSNVGEIMPNPCSPLGWDLVWGTGVAFGWMDGHFRWGSSASDEINNDQPDLISEGQKSFTQLPFVDVMELIRPILEDFSISD